MPATVSVRLDDEMIKDIELLKEESQVDRSELVRRLLDRALKQAKIEKAIELLREHKISIGKASELAEMTLYEMIELCKTHDIHIGYSLEDMKKDLDRFPIK
ncbi:MAG: UPF0175 family protein [Methanocellales archaeon]|nr:UPF0175 family protein [Methanocellales archaeon]